MAKKKNKTRKKDNPDRALGENLKAEEAISGFSNFSREEYADDIVFLLRTSPESLRGPDTATAFVVQTAISSYDMVEEPEFADIVHEPLFCSKSLMDATKALGVNIETFRILPESLAGSIRFQIAEEAARRVLTDELRQEIMERLNRYRLRKKRNGEKMEAGKAAAMMLLLKDRDSEAIWSKIGLIHGIVNNSASVGSELIATLGELAEQSDGGQREKVLAKLKDDPKLVEYLNQGAVRNYEEGHKALLSGELNFGIFTREEIDRATGVFEKAMEAQGGDSEQNGGPVQPGFSEESQKIVADGLAAIVEEVVTPERIAQTADLIKQKADEWGKQASWHFFIREIKSKFEKGPAPDDVKVFFATALYGEASTAGIPESKED